MVTWLNNSWVANIRVLNDNVDFIGAVSHVVHVVWPMIQVAKVQTGVTIIWAVYILYILVHIRTPGLGRYCTLCFSLNDI